MPFLPCLRPDLKIFFSPHCHWKLGINWSYIDFPSTVLFTSVPEVYADIHKFPEDKTHWCGFYRPKHRIISWKFNFFKKEKISFDPNSQCDNPCCPINNQWVLTTSGSWVFSLCFCQVAQFGKCKSRNLKAFICVVFLRPIGVNYPYVFIVFVALLIKSTT